MFHRYNISNEADVREAMERVESNLDRQPTRPTVLVLAPHSQQKASKTGNSAE